MTILPDKTNQTAIKIENVSKTYRLFKKPADRLKQSFIPNKQYFCEIEALKPVSFGVGRGEIVGIIGRNGSGKSTLLQLIAGTLTPTTGKISVNGRLAALLELGAGFNADFTGRENVILNAALIGLSKKEINERISPIIEFADIGRFIDQPVRTYSSGMYVRLAFAVAINTDPDILIVDEALSVGDEAFQRRCFAKIEQIHKRGATILFVSHSAALISELCRRTILLDDGELLIEGSPRKVLSLYQRLAYAPQDRQSQIKTEIRESKKETNESTNQSNKDNKSEFNNLTPNMHNQYNLEPRFEPGLVTQSKVEYEIQGAKINNTHIKTLDGDNVNILIRGGRYIYCYDVEFLHDCEYVNFGMAFKTTSGIILGGTGSHVPNGGVHKVNKGSLISVSFEFIAMLLPGTYFINCGVSAKINGTRQSLHRIIDALIFKIEPEINIQPFGLVDFAIVPRFEFSDK